MAASMMNKNQPLTYNTSAAHALTPTKTRTPTPTSGFSCSKAVCRTFNDTLYKSYCDGLFLCRNYLTGKMCDSPYDKCTSLTGYLKCYIELKCLDSVRCNSDSQCPRGYYCNLPGQKNSGCVIK